MLIFGLHFCGVFEEIIIEVVIVEFHLEPKAPAIKFKLMEVRGFHTPNKGPGLKITAGQRTMSGLIGDLSELSRLAGHVDQS